MKKIFFALILILIVLSGCTEMSREQQNFCYSLTSRSYDYVPSCETEESCYQKVDQLFKTQLEYNQENELYLLKNNFARSWFYYNRGIKELKHISKLCLGGNASTLPGPINNAKHYLSESFKEMELGIEQSINIIVQEEEHLTNEQIDLLKEEEIYYSLITLRQSLVDLENSNTQSDNFISFYLNKIEEYNNSEAIKTGNLIEKDSVLMKTYNFSKELLNKELTTVDLPIISEYFVRSLPFIENWLYLSESLNELKRLPANKFMMLYSNISGNENSVLKHFSTLMNQTSTNFNLIKKVIPKYWQQVDVLEKECEFLLTKINSQKSFEIIENKLLSKTIILSKDPTKEFNQLRTTKANLKQAVAKGIPLGEELSTIKRIKNNLEILKQTLNLNIDSKTNLMEKQCIIRAEEILNIKSKIDNQSLQGLKNELNYFSNLIIKNKTNLNYCAKMLYLEDDLAKGLNDFEKLKAQKITLTKDCFNEVETLLAHYSVPELKLKFDKLLQETVTEQNLFSFNTACNSIKTQLITLIEDDPKLIEINLTYESILSLKQKFIKLQIYNSDKKIVTQIKQINSFLDSQQAYFTPRPNYNQILIVKNELSQLLTNNFNTFEREYYTLLESTIKHLVSFEIINQQVIKTNESNELLLRIHTPNHFEDINNLIIISVDLADAVVVASPYFVKDIIYGENGQLILNNLPYGNHQIDFKIKKEFSFNEDEKVVYATTQESLVIKKITLNNIETINKLELQTICSADKAIVLINQKETPFIESSGQITFFIENASKETEIEILMYLNNKISLTKTLKEIQNTSLTKQKIVYNLRAQNLFNQDLKATLIIPFISNEKILKINIYDEIKTNKRKETILDYIVLKNQEFSAKQIRNYELVVETSNLEEYYYNQLITIQASLEKYGLPLSKDVDKLINLKINDATIKEIEAFIIKANKQITNKENELEKTLNREILEGILEEKLTALEKLRQESIELGLIESSSKIKSIIDKVKELIKQNELEKATLLIEELDFEIDSQILEEIKLIYENVSSTTPKELDYLKYGLIDKLNEVEKIIGFDQVAAQDLFKEVKQLEKEFYEKLEDLTSEQQETNKLMIGSIDTVYLSNLNLISDLKQELNLDPDKLLQLKFVLPITNQRLEIIEQKNESLHLQKTNEALLELKKLNEELLMAQTEIKKEAIKKFNLAIDTGASKEFLTESKSLMDSNNYIQSMFILNQAPQINFLWFIPILLIIIVAIVLKFNFKNNKSSEEKLQKKVLDSWDD